MRASEASTRNSAAWARSHGTVAAGADLATPAALFVIFFLKSPNHQDMDECYDDIDLSRFLDKGGADDLPDEVEEEMYLTTLEQWERQATICGLWG